jgi:YidC/Oxa1 family membrane protein insertase
VRKRGNDTSFRLLLLIVLMSIPLFLMMITANKQQQKLTKEAPPKPKVVAPLPLDQVTDPEAAISQIQQALAKEPAPEDADALTLKVAMIYQYLLAGRPQANENAVRWYRRLFEQHKRSPLAPFARYQAATILERKLGLPRQALDLYKGAYGGRRYGAVKLWEYRGGQIVPMADPGLVLVQRLDNFYRNSLTYRAMEWVVRFCGGSKAFSYGLAMVLLALVAKLVLTPVTTKQFEISRRMQLLAPEMKKRQERFHDDPGRMQKEMWAIYRQHKVSPMSGCLPMLVQAPILIGLYGAISRFLYPLEDARFLWVGSLARPDLPLLVVYTLSMWVTMKLMPTPTADPQQQRTQNMMSLMMPVMFFFFFRSLPAAFILFWFVFNLASSAHQIVLMRKMQPAPAPVGEAAGTTSARPRDKEA